MNRLRRLGLALTAFGASAAASTANAQSTCNNSANARTASVTVCVDGKAYANMAVISNGKLGTLAPTKVDLGGGSSFTISALFNSDPFVQFSFGSITLLPGTMSFDVYFNTPVTGGPYNFATSSLQSFLGAVVPPTAAGSAGISLGAAPAYLTGTADATNLGVDFGTSPCTVSTTTVSTPCLDGGTSNMFAPFSPSVLTARLSYSQTNTGFAESNTSWDGRVEILATTVPEPSTVMLLAVGMVIVGAGAAKRRHS